MHTSALTEVVQHVATPNSRLDIQQIKIRDVVQHYRVGHLVVPEFQRRVRVESQSRTSADGFAVSRVPHFSPASVDE
jgi:hypothetical protein